MDNWFSYVMVFAVGFVGGVMLTTLDHQDEMEVLENYRLVFEDLKDAGAHEWCELVLAGEIVPVEPEEEIWNGGAK